MNNKLLHVGCGHKTLKQLPPFFHENWDEVRLDLNPETKPDIVGSVVDLSAIDNQSMDTIYSSHNLEHLYSHEVAPALKEFARVLKPTGFTVITLPDLQRVAQLVVDDQLMEVAYQSGLGPVSAIDMVYGHRASVESGNHFMPHKTGFTQKSLADALINANFQEVRVIRGNHYDLWAIAAVEKQTPLFWELMNKAIIVK
ncbi:MAG: methyltransferase domain-containing protein [Methylococcales bacterium]|nr:methyltransferase domain-containing protein [Methylococcales bacterium]MCK5925331.1 methyltransferase domain-containing protein [Methylococcales bacterium]